ncbi:hypothetical protein F5Y16DRAFT_145717 [Xylariaceae sp. FL0255]|nr:hypothetical protein F5Y16DRAFT_145717 [Xylariaceae sp. FL0255]
MNLTTTAIMVQPDMFPCNIPLQAPPPGVIPDFDTPRITPVTNPIAIVSTVISVTFGLGRLSNNWRQFNWTVLCLS